jgi:hypothetical protein
MQYENFVEEFVRRTVENLRVIRKFKPGTMDRYEITQLVNSFLGLIVIPHEYIGSDIPAYSFQKLETMNWPLFSDVKDTTGCKDLRSLVEHLRNGIAHGKITFHGNKDITAMTITNRWGRKLWEGTMSVGNLRRSDPRVQTEAPQSRSLIRQPGKFWQQLEIQGGRRISRLSSRPPSPSR